MMNDDDYFSTEEFRNMLAEYEKAVNAGEPVFLDAEELAEIADYYQMNEQMDQADAAIKLALSLSPGACAPLTYCIHEALSHYDTEKAWKLLDQIIEKDDPDYIYARAEILLCEERVDEAEQYLLEVLSTVPPEEHQDYVVDVANLYTDWGISEKAMEWMSRAEPEETPDFKEIMARTLYGVGKFKDSARLFNELIDTDPFQKRYWNSLASAQYMNEDYSGAVESSEYAIAIDPNDPDSLVAKANGLYRLGNYEQAIEYYLRYLQLIPDDEFTMLLLGTCLVDCGRADEAIETLQKAIETGQPDSPYLPDIYQELAFAYSHKGDVEKAIQCLDETDTMDCDHIQMLVIKGHIELVAENVEKAEQYFREAIKSSKYPPQVLLRIVVSLYDNQYLEAAHEMMEQFFSVVDNKNREGYAYMALICHDLKREEEYMKYLEKACQINPRECKFVLSYLFPKDVEPKNYYNYLKEKS